ncbi:MAG: gliding motility protein GldM [Taibaiella sp.]|nr:gliding motility protein GldM [Taibaiella sp.]
MSIPKEPRQLMINLMYLVLTALLALNVSNEILNAFKTLSVSIEGSNRSIEQKTNEVYEAIKENEKAPGQADKVRPYRERADEVVKRSDEMVKYLNDWKKKIVMEAGGYSEKDPTMPDKMDNIDATTLLLVEKHGADELKRKILELRQFMLEQVRGDSSTMSKTMPLNILPAAKNDHNPTADWGIENFEHMPAIAAMALFSKFQNDVRASQQLIINRLFEQAHLKDIKFDTIGAVAVPKNSYVLEGDKVEASILMAAFNKANKPIVSGGGGSIKPAVNGVVAWETVAKGTGLQTVQGKITLNTESGPIERPWKFEYVVGTTGASMQLDKMNVFYIGVDNPVTVAAAGYSVEDVSLDIPGASVRDSSVKGHYNIKVDKIGTVNVAIMAKSKEQGGAKKNVGNMIVRVKRIPDPIVKVGGKTGGSMNAGLFRVQIAPAAILENFDFDTRFIITAFEFSCLPKGRDIIGPYKVASSIGCRFTDNADIKKAMPNLKAGDKVFIENIKAVGPDGKVRDLSPMVFSLN